MILQALYQLAPQERLVADPDYEPKPLSWVIEVDRDGKLVCIHDWRHTPPVEPGARRRLKPRPRPTPLPRENARTSGDRAFFLFDKAEYIFGIDPKANFKPGPKSAARQQLFKQRVAECFQATRDEAVKAVLKLLEKLESGEQAVQLSDETGESDLFAFLYAPDVDRLITDRTAVREYWQSLRRRTNQDAKLTHRCLVTGKYCAPVDLFPGIRKVPGGTASGVALVSFNKNVFESYGWRGNTNAPIAKDVAEACATALQRLVDPEYPSPTEPGQKLPRRHWRLSPDTVVCFWSPDRRGEELCSILGDLMESNVERVAELYRSVWRGKPPQLENPAAFFALVISGAQGRVIVRDWIESTVRNVLEHLARWFGDLNLVRNAPLPSNGLHPPSFPLPLLLESLAPLGKGEQIPPHWAAAIVHAALQGTPIPEAVLIRAIERYRAEIGRTDWASLQRRDARVALIKCSLLRNPAHQKEVNAEMDPTNNNPGYLLGQLMAVLERLQQEALGDVNASVVDRYFSGASACPKVVFVRLMKNARHYVRKAQDEPNKAGLVFKLERLMDVIADHFEPRQKGFPASLTLEDQGMFILGYHHMRRWLWLSKEERKLWEEQHSTAPRAYRWATSEV